MNGAVLDPSVAAIVRRLKLKLDDGSVIATAALLGDLTSAGAVRLSVKEAVAKGLSGEKDVQRLQSLLKKADELIPAEPTEDGPPAKRPRLETAPTQNGPLSGGAPPANWPQKCLDIVERVRKHLGKDAHWFEDRVNPAQVPDYYTIIKQPQWVRNVEHNLRTGTYSSPDEFYADFKLIWKNCMVYNGPTTLLGGIGKKADKKFDDLWLEAGVGKVRRATAGQHPAKYEHEAAATLPPAKPKTSGKSQQGSRPVQNGLPRTASHEVTSVGAAGHAGAIAYTQEEREHFAAELQTFLGEAGDELSDGLMQQLQGTSAVTYDAEGAAELDFEALTDEEMHKLMAWVKDMKNRQATSAPSQGVQFDNEDDDDYHDDE